ncbi:MAG TPA: hypothetical protein VNL71_04220 [Chloroflexota bacterium]|nr:hypothetical protein [Chloroflexota bacterium]
MHMSLDRGSPPIAALAAGDGSMHAPFEGFDPPESNFWRLPNNWFDLVAGFTSWAEHKVVEYVLRHTWGYHEYGVSKLITMDEFMHGRKRRDGSRMDAGCGMAENSIKKGIADAVAHGFLTVEVDDRDRGRIRKFYAPRMRRLPADEGLHALDVQGQYPIPEGQELTPHPRALTLRPQALTHDSQTLTPSPASIDPRTGQTPPGKTPREQTKKDNMLALALSHTIVPSVISPIIREPATDATGDSAVTHREPVLIAGRDANRQGELMARLLAEGIAPTRARSLVHSQPAERIERQLAWIDRRQYRNRAATLIRAIEDDFAPPPTTRPLAPAPGSFDPGKFYRGAYAVCPQCGARPCTSDCPGVESVERKSARI